MESAKRFSSELKSMSRLHLPQVQHQPGTLQGIAKGYVELLLMRSIGSEDEDNIETILSILDMDLSEKVLPDVNKIIVNGYSPFTLAAKRGNVGILQQLASRGAQVSKENFFGETGLMLASEGGHLEAVKYLIDAGAQLNAVDSFGSSPLIGAASNGHLDVVVALLRNSADVSHQNNLDQTAHSAGRIFVPMVAETIIELRESGVQVLD